MAEPKSIAPEQLAKIREARIRLEAATCDMNDAAVAYNRRLVEALHSVGADAASWGVNEDTGAPERRPPAAHASLGLPFAPNGKVAHG